MSPRIHLPSPELAKIIDYTNLHPDATFDQIDRLCDEARRYGFWSVCVPPDYVERAVLDLGGSGVKVCTVIGFPLGFERSDVKLAETERAIEDGADEIDMVMNVGAFRSGDLELVFHEIKDLSHYCRSQGKLLKVIIECCYLSDEEKVKAAKLAERAGADYVKTSTGFGPGGAKVEDVALLKKALTRSKIKAAGGIGTLSQAIQMVEAGADRLGTSSGAKIMEELAQAPTVSRRPRRADK